MAEYALKGVSSRSPGDTRDAATLSRPDFITTATMSRLIRGYLTGTYIYVIARGTLRLLSIEESRTYIYSQFSIPLPSASCVKATRSFIRSQRTRERSKMPAIVPAIVRSYSDIHSRLRFTQLCVAVMRLKIKLRATRCKIYDTSIVHRSSITSLDLKRWA